MYLWNIKASLHTYTTTGSTVPKFATWGHCCQVYLIPKATENLGVSAFQRSADVFKALFYKNIFICSRPPWIIYETARFDICEGQGEVAWRCLLGTDNIYQYIVCKVQWNTLYENCMGAVGGEKDSSRVGSTAQYLDGVPMFSDIFG